MDYKLNRLFNPKTIAIYGGGWGENVITQLKKMSFGGKIWPVHPYKKSVAGIKCFKNTMELPSGPDASFIGVNRSKTPQILRELSDIGSGGAVCFASGFSETTSHDETAKGADLQNELLESAKNMPILGPNCYGFINYLDGKLLWPDQHGGEKVSSGVAIITQSSNIAINLTMQTRKLPIAYVITTGNQSQISQAEIAYQLLDDPRVTSLGLHVEGILSPKDFERLSLKAKEKQKGIVVIKVGKSELAKEATASHTASMAGNHKAATALFNRVGMALVETIEDFLNTLLILHLNGPIFGNKIASLSCSGGEASLIADLVEPTLLEFPPLSAPQISELKKSLGALVHLSNPLDYQTYIWNDQEKLTETFSCMTRNPYDFLFIIMDFPNQDRCSVSAWEPAIKAILKAKACSVCPIAVIASIEENLSEAMAEKFFEHKIIPMKGMKSSVKAIQAAFEIGKSWHLPKIDPLIWEKWKRKTTIVINEYEAKKKLSEAGIKTPYGLYASTRPEALTAFRTMKTPTVLKLLGFSHKTENSAVYLNINDENQLIEILNNEDSELTGPQSYLIETQITDVVCELLVGIIRDYQYGLMLTIAEGGIYSEIRLDSTTICLPANETQILSALKSLKIWPILNGYRNKRALPIGKVISTILNLQNYVIENSDKIVEIEINPLLIKEEEVIAADALLITES